MLERREDLRFARDALLDAPVDDPEVRKFERDAALDGAIDAFREPHRRGAALPQFAQQAVGADDGAGTEVERRGHAAELRQAVQEIVGFDRLGQQFGERVAKVCLFRRQRGKPARALGRRQVECLVE